MTPSHHYYDKMYIDNNTSTHFVMNFMSKMSFFRNFIQGLVSASLVKYQALVFLKTSLIGPNPETWKHFLVKSVSPKSPYIILSLASPCSAGARMRGVVVT